MKTLMRWALLVAVPSFLAGCATTAPDGCDGWKPIRPAASDVGSASDGLVGQILEHNAFGAARCGWKP